MSLGKNLKVKVSIDGLCLTSTSRVNDINVGNNLGEYQTNNRHNIERGKFKNDHTVEKEGKFERCHHYRWRHIFKHISNGNQLTVCNDRISKTHLIPAIRLEFLSSFISPLTRTDVERVLKNLEKNRSLNFRISAIDLTIDLIHPTKISLHKRVNRSINPMKKRTVNEIGTMTSMGSARASNRLTSYDKVEQLRQVKSIKVNGDISRIEIRLHPHRMGNFVRTLNDLGKRGWAMPLYGRYFSLSTPSPYAKAHFGSSVLEIAVRNLKDELEKRLGGVLSNFSRDYLQEHKRFGPMVRKALAKFRWK